MEDTYMKVKEALEEVRPFLQADGGDVELVEVKDDVARVRLMGMCFGCPMAQMTLSNAIQKAVQKKAPEIKKVEQVE